MMKAILNIKQLKYFLLSVAGALLLFSCEDEIAVKYIPRVFVEGYLIVDEPISGIIVQQTQAVTDSFDYRESLIRDADVIISEGSNVYPLVFREDSLFPGYSYPDETYRVQPNKTYKLQITLSDGTVITGTTTTPGRFHWINGTQPVIQYPIDSVNLPEDTMKYVWDGSSGGFNWFLIRVKCLDTLEYGKYLDGSIEKNRRTYKPWASPEARSYKDPVVWAGPLGNNQTPFVWSVLKWFGLHEFAVFKPDINFLKWFLHIQRSAQYQPLLESVNGALGVFGSASVIYDTTFILKNQK